MIHDINSELQSRLNALLGEYPHIRREDAARCFQACVDGIQPAIAHLCLEVDALQERVDQLNKEHHSFVTRVTRLFLNTKDCFYVN
jgi:hypothetical protein